MSQVLGSERDMLGPETRNINEEGHEEYGGETPLESLQILTTSPQRPDNSLESIPIRPRTGCDWAREKQNWPQRK